MAPNISEDEIDDLIYFARIGEDADLLETLKGLAEREGCTVAEVLEEARNGGQATCLHMASANGHSRTVAHILSHLPPVTRNASSTPASEQKCLDETKSYSYVNKANVFGNTALHWACLGGYLDVVQLLLSRGASPTAMNDKDQIPLDLAAFNNHLHVVSFFLGQAKKMEGDKAQVNDLDDADGSKEGIAEDGVQVDDGRQVDGEGQMTS